MKLRIKCLYLHHNKFNNTLSCNAINGHRCYNMRCPLSEINNYAHLCKDCWKLKGINCPNSGLCLALQERPHFESIEHAIETGKIHV